MGNFASKFTVVFAFLLPLAACTPSRSSTPAQKAQAMKFQEFQALEEEMGQLPPPSPDCSQDCLALRQEFRYVVYVGQQIYCYWDLKQAETKTDYVALANSLESEITDATDLTSYYKILTRWAASLHDGHVNVMANDLSGMDIYSSPVRLELFAPATDHERLIVTTAAAGLSIAVGDEVTAVDGVPASQALDKAEEASSGSTKRMRRYFGAMSLADALGVDDGAKPLVLSIKGKGDITVARNVKIVPPPKPDAPPAPPEANTSVEAVKVLGGGIGYVRINAFGGDQEEALFNSIMDRLSQTNGLVIDMRRNGGGDLSGDRFIARFITQSVSRYKRRERWSDFLLAQRPENALLLRQPNDPFVDWHDETVEPAFPHYSKPVVVLISPYCFSACDTFSAGLKANKLATFIGEPTGGGTGTPAEFDLPISGLSFRYGVVQGETANGDLIEGQGTAPDIYLEPTVDDRKFGQDSQLARAVQFIVSGQILQNVDLVGIKPIGEQALDVSPTEVRNFDLLKLKTTDER